LCQQKKNIKKSFFRTDSLGGRAFPESLEVKLSLLSTIYTGARLLCGEKKIVTTEMLDGKRLVIL